jgi:hypothetical protein
VSSIIYVRWCKFVWELRGQHENKVWKEIFNMCLIYFQNESHIYFINSNLHFSRWVLMYNKISQWFLYRNLPKYKTGSYFDQRKCEMMLMSSISSKFKMPLLFDFTLKQLALIFIKTIFTWCYHNWCYEIF